MKKYSLATFLILLIAGCQPDDSQSTKDSDTYLTEEAPAQERSNSENGVTIKTEKAQYPASVEKIRMLIQNDSNIEFITGVHLFIEKKVDGVWYNFPYEVKNFTEEGMIHRPGELSSLGISVDVLKYELTPGEYQGVINSIAAPFEVVE